MSKPRKKTAENWGAQMAAWPKSWAGMPEDVALGDGLVAEFTPFVAHLAECELSDTTIRRHIDNLWLLGGTIVKNASLYDEVDRPAVDLLNEVLGPDDGPLVSDQSESDQRAFDGTCRKYYRFRRQAQRGGESFTEVVLDVVEEAARHDPVPDNP